MNWYLVKIVYRVICGGNTVSQFDKQLRLIFTDTKEGAFYKATKTVQKEEDVFMNINQQWVQWKFINVSELYKPGHMIDGAELYSRIEERGNADFYIQSVHKKAAGIMQSDSHQILQLV